MLIPQKKWSIASMEKLPCRINFKLTAKKQRASSTIINKNGINIEPWYILEFIRTFSLYYSFKRTSLLALSLIVLTSFIIYFE